MPSNKIITPILGGGYYHIFNRGINRQIIFFQQRNYHYFLLLIDKFISEYVSILAWCLLPNHFHLVVKIKDEIILNEEKRIQSLQKDKILRISDEEKIGKLVSNQLRRLFLLPIPWLLTNRKTGQVVFSTKILNGWKLQRTNI